jgi:hypothetical protein
MRLKFWQKKEEVIEEMYSAHLQLTLTQKRFESEFNDKAWALEKLRKNGREYTV